jgi:uncharacterized protein YegP (UPF0339 family)
MSTYDELHDTTGLELAQYTATKLRRSEYRMYRFKVGYDSGGKASWWLYASNGEMVAWAGESFASLTNAQRAANAFRAGASTARYEVYQDHAQAWRWRAWRSSDKVAASGESFSSRYAAQEAAENVRRNAGGAAAAAA